MRVSLCHLLVAAVLSNAASSKLLVCVVVEVWGPMVQLVYWSLLEYDHVPVVRAAKKALAKQMTALTLSQWKAHMSTWAHL